MLKLSTNLWHMYKIKYDFNLYKHNNISVTIIIYITWLKIYMLWLNPRIDVRYTWSLLIVGFLSLRVVFLLLFSLFAVWYLKYLICRCREILEVLWLIYGMLFYYVKMHYNDSYRWILLDLNISVLVCYYILHND